MKCYALITLASAASLATAQVTSTLTSTWYQTGACASNGMPGGGYTYGSGNPWTLPPATVGSSSMAASSSVMPGPYSNASMTSGAPSKSTVTSTYTMPVGASSHSTVTSTYTMAAGASAASSGGASSPSQSTSASTSSGPAVQTGAASAVHIESLAAFGGFAAFAVAAALL